METEHLPKPLADQFQAAQAALRQRPQISIRLRLALSFLLCFALCAAYAGANILLHRRVIGQLRAVETLEALYHKTLDPEMSREGAVLSSCGAADALRRAEEAERLADLAGSGRPRSQGLPEWEVLRNELASYRRLLSTLGQQFPAGPEAGPRPVPPDLREAAARLETECGALLAQERERVQRTLQVSAALPWLLLLLLLILFTVIVYLFNRALSYPIRRFQRYTRRIGRGDYALIRPTRWYRDEFTDLALTVNEMLADFRVNQERVVQAGKLAAVGTITSGIAHELSNPLNNIYITVETLADEFKTLTDERKWKLLQDVYFETERAAEIVKSLLDFTRQQQPEMEPLDLGEVIASARSLVQNEMDLGNVTFEARIPPGLPRISGALNPLKQVFLNLFLNAVQAMPRGGSLTVTVLAHSPGKLCVDVADTGAGIAPEVIPHIFEPFFTTKEPGKGTGLGLSVTYGIIRKHGGEIQVESTPGQGTAFHLCFPTLEGG